MRKRGSGGKGAAKSAFPVLFSVVFLDFLGFAIVIPYLFFFAESLGATPFTYGLLVSSFALMQFIFMPILGRLSDRYGRRRLIMISLLGASASYLVFGLADSLWLLFLSRIMAGVTASTYSVAQAYLADLTAEGDRLRYLGLLGAASGAALILAPALGGTLSSIYGYSVPSFLAAGLALANLFFAYFRLPEPPRARSGAGGTKGTFSALAEILRKGELKLLFYSYFSIILAVVFMDVALTPWLEVTMGYGPFEAGLLFFYIGIGQVLSRAVLLPRLARVLSHVDLTLLGLVLNTVSYISFGLMPGNLPLLLIFGFLLVLGFSVTSSTINTLISLNTPEDLQGGSLGIAQSFSGLAETIAPTIAATLFALGISLGVSGLPFLAAGLVSVVPVPLMLRFRGKNYRGTARISDAQPLEFLKSRQREKVQRPLR
jgi:multidrug resistance protein